MKGIGKRLYLPIVEKIEEKNLLTKPSTWEISVG